MSVARQEGKLKLGKSAAFVKGRLKRLRQENDHLIVPPVRHVVGCGNVGKRGTSRGRMLPAGQLQPVRGRGFA